MDIVVFVTHLRTCVGDDFCASTYEMQETYLTKALNQRDSSKRAPVSAYEYAYCCCYNCFLAASSKR
eukprot:3432296-Amphidinium_carterae.1